MHLCTQGFKGSRWFKDISRIEVWQSMAEPLQDVIWGFVEQQVRDKTSFEWISQLRYYWEVDDRQQENMWACTPDLAPGPWWNGTLQRNHTWICAKLHLPITLRQVVTVYDCSWTFRRPNWLIRWLFCRWSAFRRRFPMVWAWVHDHWVIGNSSCFGAH